MAAGLLLSGLMWGRSKTDQPGQCNALYVWQAALHRRFDQFCCAIWSGAGGMGSSGAKKPDNTPAAHQSREQVGYNSITDAVEGGIISRSTTSEPEFPFKEAEDIRPGNPQRWDADLGRWVDVPLEIKVTKAISEAYSRPMCWSRRESGTFS